MQNVREPLLTPTEVGTLLQASVGHINHLANTEQIPSVKIGTKTKFVKSQLEKFLGVPLNEPLWVVKQMVELLDVSKSQVYNMVRMKQIPFVTVGKGIRFSKTQIDPWLASGGSKEDRNEPVSG